LAKDRLASATLDVDKDLPSSLIYSRHLGKSSRVRLRDKGSPGTGIHQKKTGSRQHPDKSALPFPYALLGLGSHSVRESALRSRQKLKLF
jgi:hypothetical protein